MRLAEESNISAPRKKAVTLPIRQFNFLFLLLGVCSTLIFTTIEQASLNAVLLLIIISVTGLILCRKVQISLNDPSLRILGYFWLIKLGMTFFLLYAGWLPELDPASSGAWGYDPQRYYIEAQELVENNWSPNFISINYVGILYYYAAIYYIFGHNPVIPALINTFITLIASLYLVKVGYEIKGQRSPRDWTLAFVLLLPEILWYDVMTSRETLLASVLLIALLTTGRYLAQIARISLSKVLIVIGCSALLIAAVRTSMLLPLFASIAFMALLIKPQRVRQLPQRILLIIIASAALISGPFITEYIGGYSFNLGETLENVTSSVGGDILTFRGWSESSIGVLLIPKDILQSILFLPPRMVLYLVAPLPNVIVPVNELLGGSWSAWQKLFVLLSSVINVLVIPYALASLVQSIKNRKASSAPFVFHISYWFTFIAVAAGNLIIHERYRIMATLLLSGCAWLGARTCSKPAILRTSKLWYMVLFFSGMFYIIYKSF